MLLQQVLLDQLVHWAVRPGLLVLKAQLVPTGLLPEKREPRDQPVPQVPVEQQDLQARRVLLESQVLRDQPAVLVQLGQAVHQVLQVLLGQLVPPALLV